VEFQKDNGNEIKIKEAPSYNKKLFESTATLTEFSDVSFPINTS
jgi:hypothetical protein